MSATRAGNWPRLENCKQSLLRWLYYHFQLNFVYLKVLDQLLCMWYSWYKLLWQECLLWINYMEIQRLKLYLFAPLSSALHALNASNLKLKELLHSFPFLYFDLLSKATSSLYGITSLLKADKAVSRRAWEKFLGYISVLT